MAVLKNEQLFKQTLYTSNLQVSKEPEAVGIATDGKYSFFVYRTDERGQIAWRKDFTSFNVAHAYAKKIYRGLQSVAGGEIIDRRVAIKNCNSMLARRDAGSLIVATKKVRPSMQITDSHNIVEGYYVVNHRPGCCGIRVKRGRIDYNDRKKRTMGTHKYSQKKG